jgi:hypothetical protein
MVTQAALAADASAGGFRDRVKIAMMAAAVSVQGEAVGAFDNIIYQKRQQFATAVLGAPSAYVDRFTLAAAANSTIGGDVGNPVSVTSSTSANPVVVTTATHSLATGDTVVISGHSNAALNGNFPVTVLTATTFSLPLATSTTGTGGFLVRQPSDSNITNFGPFSIWSKMSGVTATD